MPYNTLFVPMAFEETAKSATDSALVLARAFRSHVTAHHVRQRYASYPPVEFFPAIGTTTTLAQESHDEATAVFARTVRAAFEESCDQAGAKIVPVSEALKQNGVTASWNEEAGHLSQNYSWAARVSDLIVTAIPNTKKEVFLERDILEGLLMQSGAPVIAVPRDGLEAVPRRPLIAWDGSLQASRVVRAAMPMLLESEETTLLTVGNTDPGTPSVDSAALWLARSGVNVTHRTVEWPSGPVAERVMNQCDAANADLVIMGAYSHSRLREAVLGGVTLDMLRHTERPLLLVH